MTLKSTRRLQIKSALMWVLALAVYAALITVIDGVLGLESDPVAYLVGALAGTYFIFRGYREDVRALHKRGRRVN